MPRPLNLIWLNYKSLCGRNDNNIAFFDTFYGGFSSHVLIRYFSIEECITYPASLAMEEFRDVDFGDISKSESDLYRNDSLR